MAVRRKYKTAGPVDDVAADPAGAPAEPMPMPAAHNSGNALQDALQASRHAEELQAQHGMRQQMGLPEPAINPEERKAIDAHIDRMDLSPHKTRFLKSHPSLLMEPYSQLMAHAYRLAKNAGIEDDTKLMDNAILHGIARDLEHHRQLSQLTASHNRPTPENEEMHQQVGEDAEALQREAEQILAEGGVVHQQPAPAPAPSPRKSYPICAPPSRGDVNMSSGTRGPTSITLTRDEREIAYSSFKHLSPREAELAYATNKREMLRKKAAGEIQGDR